MNKLAKLIGTLREEELRLIQKDVVSGNLENVIATRLAELRGHKDGVCPVCGADIPAGTGLKIQFGPADLRQQAKFDAPDCLKYFLENNIAKH